MLNRGLHIRPSLGAGERTTHAERRWHAVEWLPGYTTRYQVWEGVLMWGAWVSGAGSNDSLIKRGGSYAYMFEQQLPWF